MMIRQSMAGLELWKTLGKSTTSILGVGESKMFHEEHFTRSRNSDEAFRPKCVA
jgi:hypothetical protein